MKELGRLERYDKELSKNYEGEKSSTGMGNARAAKQSGVKGFGEIAEKGNAVISRDTQSLEYPVRSCQHSLK